MKLKKWVLNLLLIIFISIFLISSYKIVIYYIDSNKIEKEVNEINNEVNENNIEEVKDDETVEIVENDVDLNNPYWKYIKMNLIDVDFSNLLKTNNETKGWIRVEGTNINYPFVQHDDNEFYLDHSFNKRYNGAGWVFLDYRNKIDNLENKNTIMYGHGMKNKTMFGSLRTILSSDWLKNEDNYIVKLSTKYENTMWQVFSVYHIKTTNDYIKTDFKDDNEYNEFLNMLLKRSKFNFKTNVNIEDRILTLSTCYNKTDKVVLHAKLIKRQKKADN